MKEVYQRLTHVDGKIKIDDGFLFKDGT